MKKLSTLTTLACALSFTGIFAGELDGKTYCRRVNMGGMFGQPAGEREHCVSFEQDMMTDNANTFFGNPAESLRYVLVDHKVLVVRKGEIYVEYKVREDLGQIENEVGATLSLQ